MSAVLRQEALADTFRHFAEYECRGSSPLYEALALRIAEDSALLELASRAAPGQPVPNLLFGAVHFLLLQERDDSLAPYYPILTRRPRALELAYPEFRTFCLRYRDRIVALLRARRVQTNEVGRCSYLLIAFCIAGALADGRPLALIEMGASAGLNLLWDRYHYHFADFGEFGDPHSRVHITCTFRGERRPPHPLRMPDVGCRVGLDLNPIDVRADEDALWLRALIWPEHRQRADLLRHALAIARQDPPPLVAGDALERLPDAVRAAPLESVPCVFHTHTVNQFSREQRERLSASWVELAPTRERFCRIACEGTGGSHPQLELTFWREGIPRHFLLAFCHTHGEWIEWLPDTISVLGSES